VIFLREVHQVVGAKEDEFEAAFRDADGWMGRLAATTDDARLLWYLNQAHGSGPSYHVVTITGVADGASWERLADRIRRGDLQAWAACVDTLRHDATASILLPVAWSPLQDTDLSDVPTAPADHELSLYMEDTMWPFVGRLHDYVERAGSVYTALLDRPEALLRLELAVQPALGGGDRSVTLLQKVREPESLLRLLATEIPPERRAPGTWMHDALDLRDQWESRLLRTSSWSPRW
jgi:hypothetical protein